MKTTDAVTKRTRKGQDMRGRSSMRQWPADVARWAHARIEFARHDDRGVETAEIVIWMALVAGILAGITGVLTGILDDAVAAIGDAISDAQS